ncbi:hypothetical protein ACTPEO_00025 [Clostridioides difficile]
MEEKRYGVTQEYNRKNYEKTRETKVKKDFVENYFDGENTKVNSNGTVLHKNVKAAKKKYRSNKYAKHVLEVDHIDPIASIHKRNKHKKYINDEDICEIATQKRNLQLLSKTANAAKQDRGNIDALRNKKVSDSLTRGQKFKFVVNGAVQPVITDAQLDIRNLKGAKKYHAIKFKMVKTNALKEDIKIVSKESIYNGKSVELISLTTSSINNIVSVATREKDIDEALKDIVYDTSRSFISSVSSNLTQDAVSKIAQHYKYSDKIQLVGRKFQIDKISTVIVVGDYVVKFIDNEISAEECVTEILMNNVGIIAYELGMIAGGPAAAIITSIVVGEISKAVLEYKQIKNLNVEKEAQINAIVSEALVEMENQRKRLEKMIKLKFKKWNEEFEHGFKLIFMGMDSSKNNIENISSGLNSILSIFNNTCKFNTIREFNTFFDDTENILTL